MRAAILVPIVALLLGASSAQAAFNTPTCLAQKRNAAGNFQKCRAVAEAKLLQGKPADLAKCSTKFQDKIAKLNEKATKDTIECRYDDNGDGTVSDYDTGLQWEKKVNPGGGTTDAHDVNNGYSWSISGTAADGTAFTDFLSRLNACSSAPGFFGNAGFAGHCDWRLPTLEELQPIEDCSFSPCINPIFGPTRLGGYWSSTTDASNSAGAWEVGFFTADVFSGRKLANGIFVRAVRGGL
jgi:uncharacterized protein DUF1566